MEKPVECDLVMKGGITSGVIYPLAICRLADKYRFRSIGGASAGAIAAATAAAAEYARRTHLTTTPRIGFDKLARLPDELSETRPSGQTRLASLFQPTEPNETAFTALLLGVSKRDRVRRGLDLATRVARNQPVPILLAAVLAIGAIWFASGPLGLAIAIVCAILALVVGVIASTLLTAKDAYDAATDNFGGLCPGFGTTSEDGPPLTTWLTEKLQDVACKPVDQPLTFGDLTDHEIELVMMTTNLTHGRPHRVPFRSELLFFRKKEMELLFPEEIVNALVSGGEHALTRVHDLESASSREAYKRQLELLDIAKRNPGLAPLPDYDQLPVAFAMRLSLSFPVLLSAVPLYTEDFSLHKAARKLERVWFSDGGICSNLPVHFFDALLPKRPTFALDLRTPPHPDHPIIDGQPESLHVYLPTNNSGGASVQWNRIPSEGLPIASLIGSMIETMQSWNDNLLARAPGFRDRVVRISHLADEGGLKLEMPDAMIKRLGERGRAAGDALVARFHAGDGWNNHLWVRYRSMLGMVQPLLAKTHADYFATAPGPIDALITQPHTSYTADSNELLTAAAVNAALGKAMALCNPDLEENAPKPAVVLRVRPRDS